MFTGIIQQVGRIESTWRTTSGVTLGVDPAGWAITPSPGDSIAVAGCCLTVAGGGGDGPWHFEVVPQTLDATTLGGLEPGSPVNLESSATPDSLLGGHLVQGHVDGVGKVREAVDDETGRRLLVESPTELMDCIVPLGSITVDGVSLTVTRVEADAFEVALIPTTIRDTTLGSLAPGSTVNLETDIIARTVVHAMRRKARPLDDPLPR